MACAARTPSGTCQLSDCPMSLSPSGLPWKNHLRPIDIPANPSVFANTRDVIPFIGPDSTALLYAVERNLYIKFQFHFLLILCGFMTKPFERRRQTWGNENSINEAGNLFCKYTMTFDNSKMIGINGLLCVCFQSSRPAGVPCHSSELCPRLPFRYLSIRISWKGRLRRPDSNGLYIHLGWIIPIQSVC